MCIDRHGTGGSSWIFVRSLHPTTIRHEEASVIRRRAGWAPLLLTCLYSMRICAAHVGMSCRRWRFAGRLGGIVKLKVCRTRIMPMCQAHTERRDFFFPYFFPFGTGGLSRLLCFGRSGKTYTTSTSAVARISFISSYGRASL